MYKKYFKRIDEIFKYKSKSNTVAEIIERGFVYSEFQKKKLLFIGMNPSYLEGSENLSYSYCIEDAVDKYKRHYGKFQDLVNGTIYEDNWTYIDMFFFRETNQNKIVDLLNADIDFIINQLNLTNEIINEINPELIVICNSDASNFTGINNSKNDKNIWLGYKFVFNKEYGVEILTDINEKTVLKNKKLLENLVGKPFLFSSTLTYLDNFNKKRIRWIIDKVGKNINELNKNLYNS